MQRLRDVLRTVLCVLVVLNSSWAFKQFPTAAKPPTSPSPPPRVIFGNGGGEPSFSRANLPGEMIAPSQVEQSNNNLLSLKNPDFNVGGPSGGAVKNRPQLPPNPQRPQTQYQPQLPPTPQQPPQRPQMQFQPQRPQPQQPFRPQYQSQRPQRPPPPPPAQPQPPQRPAPRPLPPPPPPQPPPPPPPKPQPLMQNLPMVGPKPTKRPQRPQPPQQSQRLQPSQQPQRPQRPLPPQPTFQPPQFMPSQFQGSFYTTQRPVAPYNPYQAQPQVLTPIPTYQMPVRPFSQALGRKPITPFEKETPVEASEADPYEDYRRWYETYYTPNGSRKQSANNYNNQLL